MDMFAPYCGDCPDVKSCHSGYPCVLVRELNNLPPKETFIMTSAKNITSSANTDSHEKVADVTPIVPEQDKGEKTNNTEATDVVAATSKLDKLKAFAKKNQRVLIAAGVTTITTLLVLNSRRNYLAAEVEETEEPTQA